MCVSRLSGQDYSGNTEEKGCCQVIAVSRVPPSDNKLILGVFHALWEVRMIVIFCFITCFHPSGGLGEMAQSYIVLSFPYLVLQSCSLFCCHLILGFILCLLAVQSLNKTFSAAGCSSCETADLSFCCLPFFFLFCCFSCCYLPIFHPCHFYLFCRKSLWAEKAMAGCQPVFSHIEL